ncbi:MAG: hypothetical protein IKH68_09965, partial [Erysipelotrichaceae bacterium]|nr:hypothetical protein [Erysipelotrichaceae bacterium]
HFIEALKELTRKLFIKERYTLSVAGENREENFKDILADAPHGNIGPKYTITPLGKRNEGIAVPANVSFAAKSSLIDNKVKKIGTMIVLTNILTYDYLWNNIRVKGGAYGTGFRSGIVKTAGFYSYRDPNPANSLNVYKKTVEYLEDFCEKKQPIENYIVGTTGDFDPLMSLRTSITTSDMEYLMGYSYEDKAKILSEILSTTIEDIQEAIDIFRFVNEQDRICVIGNRAALEKCEDLSVIFDLNKTH